MSAELLLVEVMPEPDFDQAWRDLRALPAEIVRLRAAMMKAERDLQHARLVVDKVLRDSTRIAFVGKP